MVLVEDPGAANFAAPLPDALMQAGMEPTLVAGGAGAAVLSSLGARYTDLNQFAQPADLLARLRAAAVVVGTSEDPSGFGLRTIDAARAGRIPSVGFVDSPSAAERRFAGTTANPLQHAPDYLAVPDEPTLRRYLALGYPEDRTTACGHPHYDRIYRERAAATAADRAQARFDLAGTDGAARRIVLFAAEISTGLTASEYRRSDAYTLHGWRDDDRRTHIVIQEFLDALAPYRSEVSAVLRLHPKDDAAEYERYRDSFTCFSQGGAALPLLQAVDAVAGMTSMLLVEAALLGVRTLSIIPRASEAGWLPTAASGITPVATTRQDVRAGVERLLAPGNGPALAELLPRFPQGAAARVAELVTAAVASAAAHRGQMED